MKILEYVVSKILRWFHVPRMAIDMFKSAGKLSSFGKKTIPFELVHLNSILYSRGLLNFTFIQANPSWIYPYWINKQYNPEDTTSFIPRAHFGLSMNVTQRTWTAVGNPESEYESIVDPCGLVTPFRDGWSVDVWLIVGSKIFFPSRNRNYRQHLLKSMPVVITNFEFMDVHLELTTYMAGGVLVHKAAITNGTTANLTVKIVFAIRPFNPEGAALIKTIRFDGKRNEFVINGKDRLNFEEAPELVICHSYKEGDIYPLLSKASKIQSIFFTECPVGFAHAAALYKVELKGNEKKSIECFCPLSEKADIISSEIPSIEENIKYWSDLLSTGAEITTPDEKLNNIIKASLTTLLLLIDCDNITPGPFTYHHFWFRDAAYMLYALDRFGYSKLTRPIIDSFLKYKDADGYFRSQLGEWDSNGQMLWTVYVHVMLSNDISFPEKHFSDLFDAVKWIDSMLIKDKEQIDKPYYGLLPKGLSAEHLGLSDHYYWDNMWSIAGLKAFIELCSIMGRQKEMEYTQQILKTYEQNFSRSLKYSSEKLNMDVIPAAVGRGIDTGMIGSVCAGYPLQIIDPSGNKMLKTLKTIYKRFFRWGMFFQDFIHSGYNIYLSLQVAHSYLFAGKRKEFNEILGAVIDNSSPTLNYPEAIHPFSGGGSMGDGHHGWASADMALAVMDAFVYEKPGKDHLVFVLRGIPEGWFRKGKELCINNASMSFGKVTVNCKSDNDEISIKIVARPFRELKVLKWIIELPFNISGLKLNGNKHPYRLLDNGTVEIVFNDADFSKDEVTLSVQIHSLVKEQDKD